MIGTIAAVEDRILARLRAAAPLIVGGRWGSLASYEGELEDVDALATALGQTPAALVRWVGWGPPVEASGGWQVEAVWQIVVASRPLRDRRARRHGTDRTPGTYDLVESVVALFIGQRLGLEILPIEPGSVQALWSGSESDADRRRLAGLSLTVVHLHTGWYLADETGRPDGWPTDMSPGHGLSFGRDEGPEGADETGDGSRGAGQLDRVTGSIRTPGDEADAAAFDIDVT